MHDLLHDPWALRGCAAFITAIAAATAALVCELRR
jgi:hypothetical protein